jgi:hypothetical protein
VWVPGVNAATVHAAAPSIKAIPVAIATSSCVIVMLPVGRRGPLPVTVAVKRFSFPETGDAGVVTLIVEATAASGATFAILCVPASVPSVIHRRRHSRRGCKTVERPDR